MRRLELLTLSIVLLFRTYGPGQVVGMAKQILKEIDDESH